MLENIGKDWKIFQKRPLICLRLVFEVVFLLILGGLWEGFGDPKRLKNQYFYDLGEYAF